MIADVVTALLDQIDRVLFDFVIGVTTRERNIYVIQQDKQCFMIEFIRNTWWRDMFRTSMVHLHERLQADVASLVCGNLRTTRHVQ